MRKDERQKIKATAQSTVAEVLSENEASQKAKLVDIITEYETTLAEVKAAEVAAIEKNNELSAQLETLEADNAALSEEIKVLKDEVVQIKSNLDKVAAEKASLEGTIADLEREASMQQRTKELEEAGLVLKGQAEKQNERVRKMTDEEFAEYKLELSAIKAEWASGVTAPKAPTDPEPAKATASQLLAIKEATQKAKKGVAFVNVPTSINLEADERLLKDYDNMWSMEE